MSGQVMDIFLHYQNHSSTTAANKTHFFFLFTDKYLHFHVIQLYSSLEIILNDLYLSHHFTLVHKPPSELLIYLENAS